MNKDKELPKTIGLLGKKPVKLPELGIQDVAKLLATADINRDGKISQEERSNIFSGIEKDFNTGAGIEASYANQWARELKAGVRLSDTKRDEAQALFTKYKIPKSSYTPTDGTKRKKRGLFARIAGFLKSPKKETKTEKPGLFATILGLFNTEKKGTKTDKGTKTEKPGIIATILGLLNT
ncbi:MAG: hypothetical protein HEQ32_07485 [Vampirovibrio sp.]